MHRGPMYPMLYEEEMCEGWEGGGRDGKEGGGMGRRGEGWEGGVERGKG